MTFVCSSVCLRLLTRCIKVGVELRTSPHSSPFPHHYYYYHIDNMSSPSPAYNSFPFSFREDASAPDVVESMEQVGGLASLSLN